MSTVSTDGGATYTDAADLTDAQIALVMADLEAGNGDGDIKESAYEIAHLGVTAMVIRYVELYNQEHGCAPVIG